MAGTGATKVKSSEGVSGLVPPAVVTATLTLPAGLAGLLAVTWVGESTVKLVAAVPPKLTDVVPERLVPVTVTDVPPAVGPLVGAIPVTVGPGGASTVVVVLAELLPGLASVVEEETEAVFVRLPAVVALTTIAIVAVAPLASDPSAQVTVLEPEQLP